MTQSTDSELKPTLGLVAITINAMALIAPGAFLWTTYQLQAPPDSANNNSNTATRQLWTRLRSLWRCFYRAVDFVGMVHRSSST